MNWTDSNVMRLIDRFAENSFMYDVTSRDYHNRVKRQLFVNTLAEELGISGS